MLPYPYTWKETKPFLFHCHLWFQLNFCTQSTYFLDCIFNRFGSYQAVMTSHLLSLKTRCNLLLRGMLSRVSRLLQPQPWRSILLRNKKFKKVSVNKTSKCIVSAPCYNLSIARVLYLKWDSLIEIFPLKLKQLCESRHGQYITCQPVHFI